jgi:hypothetical protein
MWKEAVAAQFKYYLAICLDGRTRTTRKKNRTAGCQAEVTTRDYRSKAGLTRTVPRHRSRSRPIEFLVPTSGSRRTAVRGIRKEMPR